MFHAIRAWDMSFLVGFIASRTPWQMEMSA